MRFGLRRDGGNARTRGANKAKVNGKTEGAPVGAAARQMINTDALFGDGKAQRQGGIERATRS